MQRLVPAVTALAIAWSAIAAGPALADPPEGRGHKKGHDYSEPEYRGNGGGKALKYKGGGPPPWAPAHGYRAKGGHPDYYGLSYRPPFGIDLGHCNSDIIGGLLGGAAGGALGSTIGQGSGKTAAIVGGTVLGAIIGGSIGRSMDQADMTCVGQALEHASTGQAVGWNGRTGPYQVKPLNAFADPDGQYCREYTVMATIDGQRRNAYGTACRMPDGAWRKVR